MIEYGSVCEIGSIRDVNQDSIATFSNRNTGLFVVADGMGGHQDGEKASQHIVERLTAWWRDFSEENYGKDFRKMIDSLQNTLDSANKAIFEAYGQNGVCGSTVVILFIYKNAYGMLNVGDSRGFICQGRKVKQLTYDDVWENQPGITLEEKNDRNHPNRGKLISAVGTKPNIICHLTTDELKKGTKFLICSDGLYRFCSEKDMFKYLKKAKSTTVMAMSEKLKHIVYKNGAKDNLSIILVDYES